MLKSKDGMGLLTEISHIYLNDLEKPRTLNEGDDFDKKLKKVTAKRDQ